MLVECLFGICSDKSITVDPTEYRSPSRSEPYSASEPGSEFVEEFTPESEKAKSIDTAEFDPEPAVEVMPEPELATELEPESEVDSGPGLIFEPNLGKDQSILAKPVTETEAEPTVELPPKSDPWFFLLAATKKDKNKKKSKYVGEPEPEIAVECPPEFESEPAVDLSPKTEVFADPEPEPILDLDLAKVLKNDKKRKKWKDHIEARCSDQETHVLDVGWRDCPSCRGFVGQLSVAYESTVASP
ncbi:hypothetical protein EsH8_II_001481 [Colletotrichum jinshuiense]